MKASYLNYSLKELEDIAEKAVLCLENCRVCPHNCHINRLDDKKGICKTGRKAFIGSFGTHFGEERCISGRRGSGTIFFSWCNLLCCFCQNHELAHKGEGYGANAENIANIMIELQNAHAHNINFVTPSHVIPQILEALPHAVKQGFYLPLVYNSSAYDSVEMLKLLDGIVDIYMPDFKFGKSETGGKFTIAKDYTEKAKEALKEMYRQVGDLTFDQNGIATRGLLVRHLVMPEGLAQTKEIMTFIVEHISKNTFVNIMNQYRPCGLAYNFESLKKRVSAKEYYKTIEEAKHIGIQNFA